MRKSSSHLYFHADGDSFFVSCELSVRPELRGKPVIVGGDRGIAVAMSYEAKSLGVTRGMPVFRIKKELPEIIILPHNFALYEEVAEKMGQILSSYFQKVEEYSIDECFAIVEPSEIKYFGGIDILLKELKDEVSKTLGVSYSFGVARTKSLAKLASKLEKPGGVVALLSKKEEIGALKRTPINDIWGIGRKTYPKLKAMGMKTAYDFIRSSPRIISRDFSEPLSVLRKELSGIAILEVESDADPRDQKSLQSTFTFRPASRDAKIIWRELAENAEYACEHARSLKLLSNHISFFIKTSEFKYYSGEAKLPFYTADPGAVLNAIEPVFLKLVKQKARIRSTGVILLNLRREEKIPLDLFGRQEKMIKNQKVEEAADKIRQKFGPDAIRRGATLKKP